MRLNKYIAHSGEMSRRNAEIAIISERIKINGKIVKEMGVMVDVDNDVVTLDDKKIGLIKNDFVYIALNKPIGYVTTTSDEFGRKTVLELTKEFELNRIYPVGRLDINTSGLLLLTNDGDLTYRITHPKHNINKTYIANVKGVPTNYALEKFRNGLKIDDYVTSKAEIEILDKEVSGSKEKNNSTVRVVIHEGKNRQVRKMLSKIGNPVNSLERVSIGEITLGQIPLGKYRKLTEKEVNFLKNIST